MGHKKANNVTVPYTKEHQKDVKSKIAKINAVSEKTLTYDAVNSRSIVRFNKYLDACETSYVLQRIERVKVVDPDVNPADRDKKIKLNIPAGDQVKLFVGRMDYGVKLWVAESHQAIVTDAPLQQDDLADLTFSVVLQGLLASEFKRVSWNELSEDFDHEHDLYAVTFLYFKYGVLCYGFSKLRVCMDTLRYAYSSPDVQPIGSAKDRERTMDQESIDSTRAAMRHDMGVEISRSFDYQKGDPDQTLDITQENQNDEHDHQNQDGVEQQQI